MKKRIRSFVLSVFILSAMVVQTPFAHAHLEDVRGPGEFYIKIESVPGNRVSFSLCPKVGPPSECTQIGSKPSYSVHELENTRDEAWRKFRTHVGLEGGGLVVAIVGALVMPTFIGSVAVAVMSGFYVLLLPKNINPEEEYRQAVTLDDQVIHDQPVYLPGEGDVVSFSYRLGRALDGINPPRLRPNCQGCD